MRTCNLIRVRKSFPCPICKHPDWCSVTDDGTLAKCMRVEEGCYKAKQDKNGTPYYLHRLAGRPRDSSPPLPSRTNSGQSRRADADTLNSVYSELLASFVLSESHRAALRRRGLSAEAINRGGYRSLPAQGRSRIAGELRERFGDRVLTVPGFVIKEGEKGPYLTLRGPTGLIVPCRDAQGRIVALKVRRDQAKEHDPRYVYVSSNGHGGPGPGSPVHVPLDRPSPTDLVRLTEGELKADVIQALTRLPTISVPGVTNWRAALDALRSLGCKTVRLAFDADAADKVGVAGPLSACASALKDAGFEVELERWPAADGKGLDDLLAVGKAPEVLCGEAAMQAISDTFTEASAAQEPAQEDELSRLDEVLAEGGAAALFRESKLLKAIADLKGRDPAAYAAVRASLRERVSLRDLDTAIRPHLQQAANRPGDGGLAYFEQSGCLHRTSQTREGAVPVPLCNFTARIVEEVKHDDGVEQTHMLAVEGTLADGTPLPRAEVPAANYSGMNWVVECWGTRAIVYAGNGTKDHLRTAIQLNSRNVQRRTVYKHVGWREIDGIWHFLHAGGAIGPSGLVTDVPVALPEPLTGFQLPAPPDGEGLNEAIRASLRIIDLGPPCVTVSLLAAVPRAVLGGTDFGLHLVGQTGCFKSEVAALVQQHFGAGLDARHLPANWSSTANSLEAIAFSAKDAVLVVDDFCPTGTSNDLQRYHKEADRLFRGQGNHAGRQRLSADANLRPSRPPRGLILSTGEDVPRGQSLRARLLVLEVSPGDFGPAPPKSNPKLTACQQDAAAGLYAAALSAYIRWLSPQMKEIRGRLRDEHAALREQARGGGQHARTPGIIADLALGYRYYLDFACKMEAISEQEKASLWERGWEALLAAGNTQVASVAEADPASLFMRLLEAAVAGGYGHLAGPDGTAPSHPERWGWRADDGFRGPPGEAPHRPQGKCVGWLVNGEVYLEPSVSFAVVQQVARDQGDGFSITAATLRKRLKETGFLASTDEARGKLPVRKVLQGKRREVLHVIWGKQIDRDEPVSSERTTPAEPAAAQTSESEKGHEEGWSEWS